MAINNRDRNNNTRQRTRTVFVPVGGGGSKIETEELSVSKNGTYEAGEDKAYSKVTVKVTEPLGTVKIAGTGIKLGYSSFSEVPELVDFEGVTDMSHMFQNCSNLTTISEISTSNVTDMRYMFSNCSSLTTIQSMKTSNVTNMEGLFYYCGSLTTIPPMDTSKVSEVSYMFYSCDLLTTIPPIDIPNVPDIYNMFYGCSSLTTIPEMNTPKVIGAYNAFGGCTSLTDLGGFIGIKANIDLSASSLITHDSLMNIINKAADVTESPATLTLGSTNLAKLSDEEKGIATSKGWTLA